MKLQILSLKQISLRALVMLSFFCIDKATSHENRLRACHEQLSAPLLGRKRKRGSPEYPERDEFLTKRIKLDPSSPCATAQHSLSVNPQRDPKERYSLEEEDIAKCRVIDTVIELRKYLSWLPDELWSDFFCYAMEKLDLYIRKKIIDSKAVTKACEMLFCSKVLKFHTKLSTISWNANFEELIYERLRLCRKLRSLQVDKYPCSEKSEELFASSLAKLQNLSRIEMLPNTRRSFHWAVPIISKTCKLLIDLSIVYNSNEFIDGDGIHLLQHCTKLKNLSLYSYGNNSEGKVLMKLLDKVKGLRKVFHKELPNALVQSCFNRKLNESLSFNLESIVLVDYTKSIGSQLIYVPNSFLVEIATICPNLVHLNLIQPSCLLDVAKAIPSLQSLVLHQSILRESLKAALDERKLPFLTTLKLRNMELVTYEDIQCVSYGCPRLEELDVSNSNLVRSGYVFNVMDRPAFPRLRKLSFIQNAHEPLNFFSSQRWELGKILLNFLLRDAKEVEFLSLEFSQYGHLTDDILREEDMTPLLTNINTLIGVTIKVPPFRMTVKFVNAIATSSANLSTLGFVNLWDISEEDETEIRKKFSYIIKYM